MFESKAKLLIKFLSVGKLHVDPELVTIYMKENNDKCLLKLKKSYRCITMKY